MTKDEARKVAAGIAKLPELLGRARDPENEKRVVSLTVLDANAVPPLVVVRQRPETHQPSHRGHGRRDVPASRDMLLARSGVNTSTSNS